MKLLLLTYILALTMSAQTINNVSIGGTAENPTLVNNSGRALMAYVVRRITDNGIGHIFTVPDLPSLLAGQGIPEGPLGMFIGLRKGRIDHNTGAFTPEGEPVSYEITAVVFADGSQYGSDFEHLSRMFYNFRSFARDLQYDTPENVQTRLGRASKALSTIKPTDTVSMDFGLLNDRANLAQQILYLPADQWNAAITRVAALPDVVKGK